jgi:hypothetical protein
MTFWDRYVARLEAMSLDAEQPGVPLMVLRYEDLCLHMDAVRNGALVHAPTPPPHRAISNPP